MLPAFFQQKPKSLEAEPGFKFEITSYSQVDRYTLVRWRYGRDFEHAATGETLYRDRTHIATVAGALPLYAKLKPSQLPRRSSMSPTRFTVWQNVDANIGRYGIPTATVNALRDPRNLRRIKRRRKIQIRGLTNV